MTGANKKLLTETNDGEQLTGIKPLAKKKRKKRRRSMFIPADKRYKRRAKRNSTGFLSVLASESTPSRICASDSTPCGRRKPKHIIAKEIAAPIPCILNKPEDPNVSITVSNDQEKNGWVTYTVGGEPFEVARTTVLKYPNTILAKMITGEFDKSDLRIDRDPVRFRYILNWYRDGKIILPIKFAKEEIITEVRYYNLPLVESDIHYAAFPHISALSDFQRLVQEVLSTSCDEFESMIDCLICSLLTQERDITRQRHANAVALHVARELKRQFHDRWSLCSRGLKTSCRLPEGNASSFRTRKEVEIALERFTDTKKNIVDSGLGGSKAFLKLVNETVNKYDIEIVEISNDGKVKYRIIKPS